MPLAYGTLTRIAYGLRGSALMSVRSVSDVPVSPPEPLLAGALVRWPTAPGCPIGVVITVVGHQVSVVFDGEDEPKLFSARAGVLERVVLAGMVKRVSTGDVGVIQGMTTAAPPRWQVFVNGRVITVAEE